MSFAGLFVLAGLAGFIFLAVLGLITLLTSPKTRDVAKILLGALAAVVLLVGLFGALFLGVTRQQIAVRHELEAARQEATQQVKRVEQIKQQLKMKELADATADASPSDSESADTEVVSVDATAETADSAADDSSTEKAADDGEESPPETTPEDSAAPEEPEESDSAELSVPPLADDDRPAWVDRKPYKENSVYYWPVATDPRPDADEAEERALPAALDDSVADYIRTRLELGPRAAREVHLASDYVLNHLVGDDIWIEHVDTSFGTWVRLHALVKFDREANALIDEGWATQRLTARFWAAGGILCTVLFLLALVYCYLKIDQVTGGSRRGLLRFAAILVILGLMLVAATMMSVHVA